MNKEKTNNTPKLQFFKQLYENAKSAAAEDFEKLDRFMRQYRGSDEIDGSTERAGAVRNITYEIIESQVSSDIPVTKINPCIYTERRAKGAASAARLCESVRSRLPFERMNDLDERYTYVYGASVWYVEWNSSLRFGGERGGVEVHCISPRCFIPQPGISDVADMEYCFLVFTTSRAELKRKYGISDGAADEVECEYSFNEEYSDADAVSVTVCFYKDESGEVGQYVFSGEVELSDIEKYYKRKVLVCEKCGETIEKCGCGVFHPIVKNLELEVIDSEALDGRADLPRFAKKAAVPFYTPKRFPIVIRKNTTVEESVLGQSDCEFIRPFQQAINKVESRILQKLLRAGITPVMPEDASVTLTNSVFGQVIKMRPGESLEQYGKIDTTPDVSQDIAEAERLYDQAKRTLGISDAFQGIDTYMNESGVAKKLRISQANSRLKSKKQMKYAAYAEIDRLIFEHYLAFADEERDTSYIDAYGKVHKESFCRTDYIEYNKETGGLYYCDAFLFSVDTNDGTEYTREMLWERNLANLKDGTLGDMTSPITLLRYWQSQEKAQYPFARDNVEYFTEILKDKKEKEINKEC